MKVEHRLKIHAVCPVDTSVYDVYDVSVFVDRLVEVETILEAVETVTGEPDYQENITEALAAELDARIVTRGTHSGVETIVESEPE